VIAKSVTEAELDDFYGDTITWVVPEWDLEVTPGGEVVTLNGTVEQVVAQLRELNPNYDSDFGLDLPSAEDAELLASLVSEDVASDGLEKRTDFSGRNYICRGRWGNASARAIYSGIRYLRGIGGKPRLPAGPSVCSRVSCSYNAGIQWCNDARQTKELASFGSIADGAQYIDDKCHTGSPGVSGYASGQVFHETDWNVIVWNTPC
ncbi:hypothetical protein CH063_01288, partial [Colletotrichum higginsianum]